MHPSARSVVTGFAGVVLVAGVGVIAACDSSESSPVAPVTTAAPANSAQSRALLGLLDQAVTAGVPGILVRINDGTGKPWTAVKQAPWSAGNPALASNNAFRMGSNTKTVTAVIVLQLVHEGRLTLDDAVEKWLPGKVPNGANITIRMLLNHTSGLADYARTPLVLQSMTGKVAAPPDVNQLLGAGTAIKPASQPGHGWVYSNTGYLALGLVAEKITGRSMSELVEERIARPLGLTKTYLPTEGAQDARDESLIHGFEPDAEGIRPILPAGTPKGFGFSGPTVNGKWVDVTAIDQKWDSAAGAIVSTADDWAVFDAALMSGKLVPEPLLAQMRTVVPEDGSDGPGRTYGLGLEKFETPCGAVWGHDGALPGYRSDNYTDITGQHTFSVLVTTHFGMVTQPEAGKADDAILNAAACLMMGKPVPSAG